MYIKLVIFTVVAMPALASSNIFQTYSSKVKKFEKVELVEIQGLKVSRSCLNGCLALKHAKKETRTLSESRELLGNPAGRNCIKKGGFNRIFFDERKREFDFCVFSDNSAVDAWALYYKNFPRVIE